MGNRNRILAYFSKVSEIAVKYSTIRSIREKMESMNDEDFILRVQIGGKQNE